MKGMDKESPTKVGLKLKGRNLTLVDIHLSIRTGQYFNAKCVPWLCLAHAYVKEEIKMTVTFIFLFLCTFVGFFGVFVHSSFITLSSILSK